MWLDLSVECVNPYVGFLCAFEDPLCATKIKMAFIFKLVPRVFKDTLT